MKKPSEILSEFNAHIDSLPDKEKQVREIIDFLMIYGDTYGDKILPVINKGISIARSINFEAGETFCQYHLMFWQGVTQGNTTSVNQISMEDLAKMLDKLKGDEDMYSLGHNFFAFFHWFRGEYEKGFDVIFDAIKLFDNKQNVELAWNLFAIGVFYFDTKDIENSIKNFKKAQEVFLLNNYDYGIARSANGLASNAIIQGRNEDALQLLQQSSDIYRKLGHYSGLSRVLNDQGLLEKNCKNYESAVSLFNESVILRKEIDHTQGLITTFTELGETYFFMKKYEEAFEQLNQGLELALSSKTLQKQMRIYKLLYDIYKVMGNTELALKNFELFFEVKTKLLSDDAANNIKNIQTKYEREKSEKEAEIERLKNIELKKANKIIEQKNKDITDSINYAKRIQRSLMPTEKFFERILNQSSNDQP